MPVKTSSRSLPNRRSQLLLLPSVFGQLPRPSSPLPSPPPRCSSKRCRRHRSGTTTEGARHPRIPPCDALRRHLLLIQKSHSAMLPPTGSDDPPGGSLFPEWVALFTGIRTPTSSRGPTAPPRVPCHYRPLLLLPSATRLRALIDKADGRISFERAARAGLKLARAVSNAVQLHLARGLDHVWNTPCEEDGRCHHEVGWSFATETMRRSVLGGWDRATGSSIVRALEEPMAKSLCKRRRSLDPHVSSRLVSSRLVSSRRGDSSAGASSRCRHVRVYASSRSAVDSPGRSAAVAAQPQSSRRGSSRLPHSRQRPRSDDVGRTWRRCSHLRAHRRLRRQPGFALRSAASSVRGCGGNTGQGNHGSTGLAECRSPRTCAERVVPYAVSGRTVRRYGIGFLPPNSTGDASFLYPEVHANPIAWWEPLEMRAEVEAWLDIAEGRARCIHHLISILGVLASETQVRTGMPWIARLALADPAGAARDSFTLPDWLIVIAGAFAGRAHYFHFKY